MNLKVIFSLEVMWKNGFVREDKIIAENVAACGLDCERYNERTEI